MVKMLDSLFGFEDMEISKMTVEKNADRESKPRRLDFEKLYRTLEGSLEKKNKELSEKLPCHYAPLEMVYPYYIMQELDAREDMDTVETDPCVMDCDVAMGLESDVDPNLISVRSEVAAAYPYVDILEFEPTVLEKLEAEEYSTVEQEYPYIDIDEEALHVDKTMPDIDELSMAGQISETTDLAMEIEAQEVSMGIERTVSDLDLNIEVINESEYESPVQLDRSKDGQEDNASDLKKNLELDTNIEASEGANETKKDFNIVAANREKDSIYETKKPGNRQFEDLTDGTTLADISSFVEVPDDMDAPDVLKLSDDIDVVHQLADEIHTNLHEDKSEMIVHLKPDFLGKVVLKISLDGDVLSAKIVAQSHETGKIISTQIDELKENLSQEGYTLGSLDVDIDQGNSQPHRFYNENWNSLRRKTVRHLSSDIDIDTDTGSWCPNKSYGANSLEIGNVDYFA